MSGEVLKTVFFPNLEHAADAVHSRLVSLQLLIEVLSPLSVCSYGNFFSVLTFVQKLRNSLVS